MPEDTNWVTTRFAYRRVGSVVYTKSLAPDEQNREMTDEELAEAIALASKVHTVDVAYYSTDDVEGR